MASTTKELAEKLQEIWVTETDAVKRDDLKTMIEKAQAGYYHDFKSPIAFPKMKLTKDLYRLDLQTLAQEVQEGLYDEDEQGVIMYDND